MKYKFQDIYINYKTLGTRGDWIVFLHGWGGSIESFEIVAKNFENFNRCLILDFPPFGGSEEPYEAWNVDTYAMMTMQIIRHLKIKKFHIVAHSFGGRVAISIASVYNNMVDKMILVDSAGIKPRFNVKKFMSQTAYKISKKLGLNTAKYGSSDYRSLSPMMKKTFVNIVQSDLKKHLKNISCETLIIFGENDHDTPLYMAKVLNKKIKNSALIVFKGCGHFSYLDDYQKFVAISLCFLKG